MKNGVLLRRIILLLLSAVMLSGLLSAGIYIFVTQRMYVQMRADELKPIARSIADMLTDIGADAGRYGRRILERDNRDFLGALLHVYDAEGHSLMNPPHDGSMGKKTPSEYDLSLGVNLNAILSGKEISEIGKLPDGRSHLIVGVPIQDSGKIIGAVIFTKPIVELSDAMRGMNVTLLISTLIAFVIMLIPGYFIAKWITVPIRQMKDVAWAMSQGNFSVRADEAQKGEIGELAQAMNYFAAESGRLEQTRRDYVANVSHELRTPIAAIRAMGETLRDGMAKSEDKRSLFYNNIVRESMRLSRLVDDLLELSRLQSSTEPLRKTCFDLREVMQNVIDVYSHVASEAGLRFTFTMDMDKELLVFSNADRVEQVLIILLDNAIKHTPRDGIVTLSVAERGNVIELSVADTGEGIPEEDIPHIFERFYTADKSHSGGGTGLGLSIAYEIVKGLGEAIGVKSNSGGTTFTLTAQNTAAPRGEQ